ncbi:response regulator [Enterococcus timonensis]|uniref:response regulator n=1 Tax=Enterococcus timonensis TaxID=1852364 RepID=UPI0008DAD1E0|nr:response regulator [Enterococcus timonensis]
MEKYTLLIVDDEAEVLQVMIKKINWESLGFTVIGTADNGLKAIEMMEKYQPDVMMTDIRMPYMDGLELSQRVRTEFPATKILIFSGFDEFEYVKEALRLEVGEYILKPVSSIELTEIFTQLKVKLDQEISESRNVENLEVFYQESLPLMQNNFYSNLLEGRIKEEDLDKYLVNYQIPLNAPYYCCLVLHTSLSQVPDELNPVLMATSVQQQAQKYFSTKWQAHFFSYLGETIILVQLQNTQDLSELTDECDRFCKYVLHLIKAVVTIGIGQICDTIIKLEQSYTSGRMAVSYRGIYGASRVININEVAPQEAEQYNLTNETDISDLFKKIHTGSKREIEDSANHFLDHLYAQAQLFHQHTVAVSELIGDLYQFTTNNSLSVEEILGNIKELYLWLPDLNPEALRKWLVEVSLTLNEKLASARNSSTQTLVLKAQEYVRHHFSDTSLSLDDLTEILGVSNSYFSSIFKKVTGETFISYLTNYRLNIASRLLLETDEKSYVISEKVGYADPNYFSYVFKRRFGQSPLKYRMGHEVSET